MIDIVRPDTNAPDPEVKTKEIDNFDGGLRLDKPPSAIYRKDAQEIDSVRTDRGLLEPFLGREKLYSAEYGTKCYGFGTLYVSSSSAQSMIYADDDDLLATSIFFDKEWTTQADYEEGTLSDYMSASRWSGGLARTHRVRKWLEHSLWDKSGAEYVTEGLSNTPVGYRFRLDSKYTGTIYSVVFTPRVAGTYRIRIWSKLYASPYTETEEYDSGDIDITSDAVDDEYTKDFYSGAVSCDSTKYIYVTLECDTSYFIRKYTSKDKTEPYYVYTVDGDSDAIPNEYYSATSGAIPDTMWSSTNYGIELDWYMDMDYEMTKTWGNTINTSGRSHTYDSGTYTNTYDVYYKPGVSYGIVVRLEDGETSGSWVSESIDMSNYTSSHFFGRYDAVDMSGGTATITVEYATSADDSTWSAYSTFTENTDIAIANYVRFKVSFTGDGSTDSSYAFYGLFLYQKVSARESSWISETVNVSHVDDTSSGVCTYNWANGGTITVSSRSSADGSTWSAWAEINGATGALTSAANDYIQIKVVTTGEATVVYDITVTFDYTSAPASIKGAVSLTSNATYSFASFNDSIYMVNGNENVLKWTGTGNISELASTPALTDITLHNNILWGVSATYPSRVRYSNISDGDTWDVLDFFDFHADDGDYITAIMSHGNALVVSKRRSIARLLGNSSTTYNIAWTDFNLGVVGREAMCAVENYVFYMSYDGLRVTDYATSTNLTDPIKSKLETLNDNKLSNCFIEHYNGHIYIGLTETGYDYNTVLWDYNIYKKAWTIKEDWHIYDMQAFLFYGQYSLIGVSSDDTYVYDYFKTSLDDGETITYTWKSKEFNFDEPARYKIFRRILLDIEGIASEDTLTVYMYLDGDLKGTYSTTIPAGAGTKHARQILPPIYDVVLGRHLSIKITGSALVHNVAIDYVVKGIAPESLVDI